MLITAFCMQLCLCGGFPNNSLLETAAEAGLSKFVELVGRAGLEDALLTEEEDITILAPTNEVGSCDQIELVHSATRDSGSHQPRFAGIPRLGKGGDGAAGDRSRVIAKTSPVPRASREGEEDHFFHTET